jgi:elongator complex protein 3
MASEGKEVFIQIVNEFNALLGFVRLRLNSTDIAYIRELHVYGAQIAIGQRGEVQHKGFGKRLLQEAEKIAKLAGKKKIYVISGIGVREYYKKQGYEREGLYMAKNI